ncbi:elongator complex protein 4-like [Acanthaster planci]|uniref:Elongator complex protein 4 n=1 Tax=Acanthaster planci TaxID=133434 RepID=A0A8B7ZLH3_ACAPL|nr:elongator complex protein 4-like [Acanthaster planci]
MRVLRIWVYAIPIFLLAKKKPFYCLVTNMAAPSATRPGVTTITTSFQKKTRGKVTQIPGTRPSLQNGQLLVSSGVPSLDFVVGGGIAVGTTFLIEEDAYGNYASLLLRYFLAEGVMTGQSLFLSSADEKPQKMLKNLPCPVEDDPVKKVAETIRDNEGAVSSEDRMKIAWRYEHLPKHQSTPSTHRFGHFYDLSKSMPSDRLSSISCHCVPMNDESGSVSPYLRLFQHIEQQITEGGFSLLHKQSSNRNILRIAIHSLASPLWGEEQVVSQGVELCQFLHALRALLRNSLAVCVITMPTHLFADVAVIRRVERLCDTAVRLESFAGSDKEKNPVYKEYHGLFHIKQLPRLNSLSGHMPDTTDLAFKLKRKKLTIEKLHLPPELSETVSRPQEDPVLSAIAPSLGCGSTGGRSKLDF